MRRPSRLVVTGICALLLAWAGGALRAQVIAASFDNVELEKWLDVNKTDGPITIHRLRISTQQTGFRSWGTESYLNRDYLQRLGVQLEYTNDGVRRYKSYITVRLVDGSGEAIDGFGDEEGLESHRARGLVERSFPASKYGLKRMKRLELEIKLNP
jgi:hypothetical protein